MAPNFTNSTVRLSARVPRELADKLERVRYELSLKQGSRVSTRDVIETALQRALEDMGQPHRSTGREYVPLSHAERSQALIRAEEVRNHPDAPLGELVDAALLELRTHFDFILECGEDVGPFYRYVAAFQLEDGFGPEVALELRRRLAAGKLPDLPTEIV